MCSFRQSSTRLDSTPASRCCVLGSCGPQAAADGVDRDGVWAATGWGPPRPLCNTKVQVTAAYAAGWRTLPMQAHHGLCLQITKARGRVMGLMIPHHGQLLGRGLHLLQAHAYRLVRHAHDRKRLRWRRGRGLRLLHGPAGGCWCWCWRVLAPPMDWCENVLDRSRVVGGGDTSEACV